MYDVWWSGSSMYAQAVLWRLLLLLCLWIYAHIYLEFIMSIFLALVVPAFNGIDVYPTASSMNFKAWSAYMHKMRLVLYYYIMATLNLHSSSMQLAINVQIPQVFGGLAGEAVYIGTNRCIIWTNKGVMVVVTITLMAARNFIGGRIIDISISSMAMVVFIIVW